MYLGKPKLLECRKRGLLNLLWDYHLIPSSPSRDISLSLGLLLPNVSLLVLEVVNGKAEKTAVFEVSEVGLRKIMLLEVVDGGVASSALPCCLLNFLSVYSLSNGSGDLLKSPEACI